MLGIEEVFNTLLNNLLNFMIHVSSGAESYSLSLTVCETYNITRLNGSLSSLNSVRHKRDMTVLFHSLPLNIMSNPFLRCLEVIQGRFTMLDLQT